MKLDRLVQLISQQWAIHPEVLENWCQILDAKLSGLDIPQDLAASGSRRNSGDGEEPFTRDGNIAIVPVVGTLVKTNSFFSCDATYAQMRAAVAAAVKAKGIDAIVLDGDTPGGTVAGVQEASDFLAKANRQKPIYGWVDDLAASAGYWLLSQTRMIGAHAAADIGSIGVLTVHYDRSGRDAKNGVQRTVLAVGDLKAAGSDTGPLSGEDRSYIMDRLEQTYSLFRAAVVRGRPQLDDQSILDMQSRVYKAAQARDSGLIDHVMGRDEYIDLIKRQTRGAVRVPIKGVKAMNVADFRAEHPELAAQIETEARQGMIAQADHDAALSTARSESATSTRSGLLSLHAAVFGEDAGQRFSAIVESGVTAEQAQALGVTATVAAPDSHAAMLEAITNAAPAGLRPGQPVPPQSASIDSSAIYASRK